MAQIKTKYITNNNVTNAKLAQMAAGTVKANTTGATANASDAALGTVTEATSSVLILTGFTNATIGSPTIQVKQASGTQSGYLSSTDWTTFNNKGTVTSVSVTTANGVSGTVATATTTPAITLTLGAITPSSVAATGTVTGSNLSGTNSGDVTLAAVGTTGSANAAILTGQSLALQQFTSTQPGVVPASGGGTTNYLRADGTWAAAGGGSSTAPTIQKFTAQLNTFTITAGPTASIGAVYKDANNNQYTVSQTLTGAQTTFVLTSTVSTGTIPTSGNLTKVSGTGTTPIAFSARTLGGTYTRPTSPTPLYIRVVMVGGGGAGGESGATGTAGNAGGATTFGTSLLSAGGGAGGGSGANNTTNTGVSGGAGGVSSLGSGPIGLAISGGAGGGNGSTSNAGGMGGSSYFGGSGPTIAANPTTNGTNPAGALNTGGGGAGGINTASTAGAGGGSGGFVDAIITSPASTYAYNVGNGGFITQNGNADSGNGGNGVIVVYEYYQ